MKKILLLVSSAILSASVLAAPLDLAPGGATGSTTTVAQSGATLACAALSTDTTTTPVKVGLSKENIGSIDCSATDVGVSVASTKGKAKMYSVGSGGGSEIETGCAASPCAATDVEGQATSALSLATSS